MAAAARRTAQDRFCASRIIPLYERFYESIIAALRARRQVNPPDACTSEKQQTARNAVLSSKHQRSVRLAKEVFA